MQLAELQKQMQARVLGAPSEVAAELAKDQSIETSVRLGIYEDAYLSRLEDALSVTYPALQRALGIEAFSSLARRFAIERPSSYRSIRYYGQDFSEFLAVEVSGTRGRGLSELARWEWMVATVFDAADSPGVVPIDLAAVTPPQWPRLTFHCSPTLRRLRLATNAVKWWRADVATSPRQWRLQRTVEWALWRRDLKVYFRSLPADEAHALDQAIAGATFGSICESLSELHRGAAGARRAATMLFNWWRDGLVIDARPG